MSRLLKISPRFARRDESSSTKPNQDYDQESGLVYTQVSHYGGPMTSDWVRKTTGSSEEYGQYRSPGPGCSSLKNTAIRITLLHSSILDAECLETIPWQVGQQLWNSIVASQLDSVHLWKIFASVYSCELDEKLKRRDHFVVAPNMGLPDYTKHLISPSFQWVTFLTLSNISCSRTDLVQISQLTNLGVFTVGKGFKAPDIGLDDSVMRAWGRAATQSNAFSMLRVLSCRSQKEITARSFSYLKLFPSLALFNVEDCNISSRDKPTASSLGWKYMNGKGLSDFLVNNGATSSRWSSIIHACFTGGGAFSIVELTAERVEAINSLPVLHFSLGSAPADATVDASGKQVMRSFRRRKSLRDPPVQAVQESKRPLDDFSGASSQPCKKPMLRASKQQSMETMFMSFGT